MRRSTFRSALPDGIGRAGKGIMLRLCLVAIVVLLAPIANAEVTIDWVTVGDPGNAGDPQESCLQCVPGTTFGAVSYSYRIGKYEVTNAQYAEFLNAVAATDTYDLMAPGMAGINGGITRSGSAGSYTYSTIAGRENMPVNYVSFYDSLRFANWLHNGQPTGAQDSTTTEDGAYTFSDKSSVGARNQDATIFLPSEDEWYKAAYFNPFSNVYYDYAAGTNLEPLCTFPGTTANTANCHATSDGGDNVGDLTNVGSYTGSASPNGTFDQGGNVREWNEELSDNGLQRGRRGGARIHFAKVYLAAWGREFGAPYGDAGNPTFGFRVASPVPPVPSIAPLGIAMLLSLLGLGGWRRLRA